jgi:dienelactone hydrolase
MQMKMRVAAACLAFGAASSATVAEGQNAAAVAFGARPMVQQASLSPDGMSVALIEPLAEPQASALFVARLDGAGTPKPLMTATGHPDRLQRCDWVSNDRLVCKLFMTVMQDGRRLGYTRLLAVSADGSKVKELTAASRNAAYGYRQNGGDIVDWLAGDQAGAVLMTRQYIPEQSAGTLLSNRQQGLGVDRIDTTTLVRSAIEAPRGTAAVYLSDQYGAVRIVGDQPKTDTGYDVARVVYSYRPAAGGSWTSLGTYDDDAHTGFYPVAVDRALNAAYGFEWIDGRQALTRVVLDRGKVREVILARPDVDVDGVIEIGRQHRVVGASFATDKRETVFFDPVLQRLAASLSGALPGHPTVTFVDASLDESRLLLWAGSDVEAGRYYLFDKTTHKLGEVMPERPQLAAFKLAPVKPVTYRAADGVQVPAYLTLPVGSSGKNLPAIVMPHGGPSARDEWGFDWLAQYFASRGFAVLQPNFRGSSGYGEGWFARNGFQSWRSAIGDVNDAGRWLQTEGIAAPGKLAIVGWSYGGYAALQSAVLDPQLFKAIIAIAPVTDLESLREESRYYTSRKIVDAFIGHGDHVREGSPAQNASRIKAPVLIFHGDDDATVSVAESRTMASRIQAAGGKVDLVVFPALDHQLDDSRARADMLDRSDGFLRNALGVPASSAP